MKHRQPDGGHRLEDRQAPGDSVDFGDTVAILDREDGDSVDPATPGRSPRFW